MQTGTTRQPRRAQEASQGRGLISTRWRAACLGWASAWLVACGGGALDLVPAGGTARQALAARCTVEVIGVGEVDVETDYLPHVVQCENGAADYEALKAQAVAARSYLYYRLATGDGTIVDGQRDQVYSCGRTPTMEHVRAVQETSGEVLMYQGTPVAAFYVAGAIPSQRDSCIAIPGDLDYSDTERYVTPNWEYIGDGVAQTPLGWIHPANLANRGCKSQNGAHCLAEAGWSYEDILLFYYGADIEHVAASGSCAQPTGLPHGCGRVVPTAEGSALYAATDACFVRGCPGPLAWDALPSVIAGQAWSTSLHTSRDDACVGRWRLSFAEEGTYAVEVHIPAGASVTPRARYQVMAASARFEVEVALPAEGGFVHLGAFDFAAGSFQGVERTTAMADSPGADPSDLVVFDALRVSAVLADPHADAGVPGAGDGGDDADGGAPDSGGSGRPPALFPFPPRGEWSARIATWPPAGAPVDHPTTTGDPSSQAALEPGFSCAQGSARGHAPAGGFLSLWLVLRAFVRRRRARHVLSVHQGRSMATAAEAWLADAAGVSAEVLTAPLHRKDDLPL